MRAVYLSRVSIRAGVPYQDEHPKSDAAYGIGFTLRHVTPARVLQGYRRFLRREPIESATVDRKTDCSRFLRG